MTPFHDILARIEHPWFTYTAVREALHWNPFGRRDPKFVHYLYLQPKPGSPVSMNNDTGEEWIWKSRKWVLSEHMTTGEVMQTALLATLTAMEHETRELFTVDGIDVFSGHYDIEKLITLRKDADAILHRRPPPIADEATVSDQ